jgi:phosphonate transport system substrate-binding protein
MNTVRRLAIAILALLPLCAAAQLKQLTVCANPNLSSLELLNNFGAFARALEQELGMPVKLVAGRDYDDTLKLLKEGKVDIAGTGAFGYVSANEAFGAHLLVRYVEDDGDSYHALIITRTDSGIHNLAGLRGKRFAFTDPKSTSGYLLPLLAMQQAGVDAKDLGKIDFVKKQPNSAIAVYSRQADAGAIADNQLNEKYGVQLKDIKVLWKSAPIPHGAWIVRPDMAEADRRQIAAAIMKIGNSPEGKKLLAHASVRGFAEGRDAEFDGVRAAKRLLDKLEKKE